MCLAAPENIDKKSVHDYYTTQHTASFSNRLNGDKRGFYAWNDATVVCVSGAIWVGGGGVKVSDHAERAALLGCLRAFRRVGLDAYELKSLFLGLISQKRRKATKTKQGVQPWMAHLRFVTRHPPPLHQGQQAEAATVLL